jgi:hypothetical protein
MTIEIKIENMYMPDQTWRFKGVHGWQWVFHWQEGLDATRPYPVMEESDGNIVFGDLLRG